MGVPLPTGTLYQVNRRYWPGEDDYTGLSDAERMERQADAYHGRFKRPLQRDNPTAPDHNVISNRCEPIVSTGVDFLLGDEVSFEVVNDDGSEDEEAQTWLDGFWEANSKMPTLAEYEINSGNFGHSFFKLIPDDDDTYPYPSLAVLSPQQMHVDAMPADVRKVKRYVFTYEDEDDDGNPCQCRQVTERQQSGAWVITDQYRKSSVGNGSVAAALADSLDPNSGWVNMAPPALWPYKWSPIHDSKNLPEPNSYWGKADLRLDLIHLNDVLNFMLSDAKAIIYAQGQPKDVFFGIRARDLEIKANGAICIPSTNARVQHIEMTGDLAAIRMFIQDVKLQMDELSHVPAVAVGELSSLPSVPSGVALKVAYRPLINQTLQKRNLRSAVYTRLCQHVLELGGFGEARKIVIGWSEMVPQDDLEDSKTAVSDQAIGASNYTLLKKRGFDPEFEAEKKADEAEDALKQAQALAPLQPAQPDAMDGADGMEADPNMQSGMDAQDGAQNMPSAQRAKASGRRGRKKATGSA